MHQDYAPGEEPDACPRVAGEQQRDGNGTPDETRAEHRHDGGEGRQRAQQDGSLDPDHRVAGPCHRPLRERRDQQSEDQGARHTPAP